MEILNIGPLELILILVIMFILLGPKEMVSTAQRIGQWVRKITRSPQFREILGYTQDIRDLPKTLLDETGLQDTLKDIQQTSQSVAADLNSSLQEARQTAQAAASEVNQVVEQMAADTRTALNDANVIAPPAADTRAALNDTNTIAPPAADTRAALNDTNTIAPPLAVDTSSALDEANMITTPVDHSETDPVAPQAAPERNYPLPYAEQVKLDEANAAAEAAAAAAAAAETAGEDAPLATGPANTEMNAEPAMDSPAVVEVAPPPVQKPARKRRVTSEDAPQPDETAPAAKPRRARRKAEPGDAASDGAASE